MWETKKCPISPGQHLNVAPAYCTHIAPKDVMRLDNSGRINTPGRAEGNWAWRMGDSSVWERLKKEGADLRYMAGLFNRLPKGQKFEV